MLLNYVRAAKKVLACAALAIAVAEDLTGGSGEDKRAAAIADIKAQVPPLVADLGVPEWAMGLILNDAFLGLVVDKLVALAHAAGDFIKKDPEAAPAA